jgi:hypothetical protein
MSLVTRQAMSPETVLADEASPEVDRDRRETDFVMKGGISLLTASRRMVSTLMMSAQA